MASQVPNYAGTTEAAPAIRNFSWSGIFAGTFLFIVIEATFGTLGSAIFAPVVGPNTANSVGTMSIGGGIWMVILSAIAMYFAARLSSVISGATTRAIGMRTGLVTFGMSIFATILVLGFALGSRVGGTATAGLTGPSSMTSVVAEAGYWSFITLFLSMLASARGGIDGARRKLQPQKVENPQSEPRAVA